jgi:hypothetical protein
MADYRLIENGFVGNNLGTLFHSPNFFLMHSKEQGSYFEWVSENRVVATVNFTEIESGVWRSPARGTFSGYAFDSDLDIESLFDFHQAVCTQLKLKGAKSIELLLSPMAHDYTITSNQFYMLKSDGFEIAQCNLNHSVLVDNELLSEKMSYGNRKRLKKCLREGLLAEKLPTTELSQVYETLDANRKANGHHMSMTLDQLEEMINAFPDRVVLFGIRDNKTYAAAALCLRLSDKILYVFYWGDRPGYSAYSPVVAIADVIYSFCYAEGIKIMDIGTSTLGDEPNHGLIRFKRGLGFKESLKLNMVKKYD